MHLFLFLFFFVFSFSPILHSSFYSVLNDAICLSFFFFYTYATSFSLSLSTEYIYIYILCNSFFLNATPTSLKKRQKQLFLSISLFALVCFIFYLFFILIILFFLKKEANRSIMLMTCCL